MSMHPAVLYASGPRERTDARGRVVERRDDTMPKVAAGAAAATLTGALLSQANRRSGVLNGRGDERRLTTRSGNVLAYRRLGPDGADMPTIVLESGLIATAEHWEWIARELADRFPIVTYNRAGYGPSAYRARRPYTLDVAVGDLADLVRHVGGARPVVLVGHSLGGWLALRTADAAPEHVAAVGLLDSPAVLYASGPRERTDAPAAELQVIEGADHDQVLTHPKAARRVAGMVGAFAAGLQNQTQEVMSDAQPAR
jgi:predicted alpha/beta-fold hydrolase